MENNFTISSADRTKIRDAIVELKGQLDLRKPVWDRIPDAKKRAWIKSGKDPEMSLAWDVYRYLNNNFFDRENADG